MPTPWIRVVKTCGGKRLPSACKVCGVWCLQQGLRIQLIAAQLSTFYNIIGPEKDPMCTKSLSFIVVAFLQVGFIILHQNDHLHVTKMTHNHNYNKNLWSHNYCVLFNLPSSWFISPASQISTSPKRRSRSKSIIIILNRVIFRILSIYCHDKSCLVGL